MDGNNHYIKIDVNNIVITAFSDDFQASTPTDILIESNAGRHYNPQLTNEKGQYIYKYINSQMLLRTDVELFDLTQYKLDKINLLKGSYVTDLNSSFFTSAIGSTPVEFSYDTVSQDRFTKKSTLLSLNPTITSVDWKSKSNGFITVTRDQFITILNDAATHETTLAFKLLHVEANIINATTKDQVDLINW